MQLSLVSLFPYSGLVVHPIKGRLELASNYSEYIKVPFLSIYMLPVVFFFYLRFLFNHKVQFGVQMCCVILKKNVTEKILYTVNLNVLKGF